MIKAEPCASDKKDKIAIGVEFDYPSFMTKSAVLAMMELELTAILHAIHNEYCPEIVENALEQFINDIKNND